MNVLDHEKLHQKYFEELSRIPRASFKEERVSDYLEDFARTRGLDYKRDTIGNVVIYKPASAGYEEPRRGDPPGTYRHGLRKECGLHP